MARDTTEWAVRILCTDPDDTGAGTHAPFGFGRVIWTLDHAFSPPARSSVVTVDQGSLEHFWTPDIVGDLFPDEIESPGRDPVGQIPSRTSFRLRCPRCRRDVRILEARWEQMLEQLRANEVESIELKHLNLYR